MDAGTEPGTCPSSSRVTPQGRGWAAGRDGLPGPCGTEPAELLLREVPGAAPGVLPSTVPTVVSPASAIGGCTGRFRSHAPQRTQEPGQAPGMLETSAPTNAVPTPASIDTPVWSQRSPRGPQSPSAPCPCLQREQPVPSHRSVHAERQSMWPRNHPSRLGDAPHFARVTAQKNPGQAPPWPAPCRPR